MDYYFIKKWKKEMYDKISLVHPEWDEKIIQSKLDEIIDNKFKDHKATIRNTYKGTEANTSLLNIIQFIHDYKPITAGYGVLYRNQDTSYNPAAGMLMESITTRNGLKKERKKYDKRSYEFLMLDIDQGNEKVIANSYYGAQGAKTSIFYNRDIASSVTATGQAEISTAETSIEAFIARNFKFFDEDEFMLYINRILSEKYEDEIPLIPDIRKVTYEFLLNNFVHINTIDKDFCIRVLDNLTDVDLTKIYLKNNLMEFLKYFKPANKLMRKLINKTKSFKDPNNVPEEIHKDLDKVWDYIVEFVVYNYPIRNRIERDKYHKRGACITQDTDSTMVTMYNPISILINEFADDEVAAENDDEFEYILVNILSYFLTKYCQLFLKRYCTHVNIPETYHWCINMKNEFYYPKMVLTEAKKHYLTLTKLQEGKEINPPKIESHGMEYIKADTSDNTREFFENLVKDDIMYADEINVSKILRKLKGFENIIKESLEHGETTFLSLKSVKEPEAYDKPFSDQGIRAVRNWNFIYPGMQINLPEKVLLVKLTTKKRKDISIELFGEFYDVIMKETFDNPNETIARNGFDIIAIPQSMESIPSWIIPLIDFNTIIDDNVSKFNPIVKSLGAITLDTRATDTHMSNIIDI